jgi:methionine--tRNA ligase beta chain
MDEVNLKDWSKLDLRVGKILKVEDIEGADKLYKLEVDIGTEKRTLAAGIKEFYKKEELEGKNCVVFVNLTPRTMKGVESKGMILAADEDGKPTLIAPENDVEIGSKIR